ncbi:hypothetical protein MMC06_006700 [Schaereria dolodes]|nr:hypothetical protein [Schaereria dolodes]
MVHQPSYRSQWVWPRDKRQTGARTWGRFKDVLTGKGPNIWVSHRGTKDPTRPLWSEWRDYDNLGYPNRLEKERPGRTDIKGRSYDFKSRTYRRPQPGIWSDAKWSYWKNGGHYDARYVRGSDGVEWSDSQLLRNPWRAHHLDPWHLNRWGHLEFHPEVFQNNWTYPWPPWYDDV